MVTDAPNKSLQCGFCQIVVVALNNAIDPSQTM